MKHKILVGLIASLAATSALAQSNVTVYGLFDTAIRYTTNEVGANGTVGNQFAMVEGAFQGPRIGFKGEEDLGGGMSAVFKLENGFQSNNGAFDQQGQIFGRQAYVGLKDKSWGEIDAGRQYGAAFDMVGNYDTIGIGNFLENSWEDYLFGLRFDNTLKYTNTWGPISAQAQYSIGGQAASSNIGGTTGFILAYTEGPLSVGGMFQQSTDTNSKKMTAFDLGATYIAGPETFYLSYLNTKRDPGFAKAASNSGGALANTSIMGNAGNTLQRTDSVWTIGTKFQAQPNLAFIFGYMSDSVTNESSLGDSGKISTAYAIADYNLSKRIDVYFDIDRTVVGGGEIGNGADTNTLMAFSGVPLGGNSTRTGVAVGLRVKF